MKKKKAFQSAFLTRRIPIGSAFCAIALLGLFAFALHSRGSALPAPKQQNQLVVSALAQESAIAPNDRQPEATSPTLGDYADASVSLSGNAMVIPSVAPANTTSVNVSTNTNFKGTFVASLATGVVRVTDAHPVGTYNVTVTAFGPGGTATKNFSLTVSSNPCGAVSDFTNGAGVGLGSGIRSVAIGDFNGDGKQDFAVANWAIGAGTTVSVRLGDGLGGFGSASNVSVGTAPISIAIGDFNGDGKQDMAVANDGSSTVSIRLGNGSGGFSGSTNVPVGSHPLSIAVGDFNGDGKQDFATANHDSNNVSIRLGDGLGGFSGTTSVSVGDSPFAVAIGDFNGDGKQDLAVANSNSNSVSIRLGDGLGGFSGSTEVSVGSATYSIAIGDFNGDGKQDLAAPDNNSDRVFIRFGDGLGNFSGSTEISVGSGPYGIAIGDFNGDGNQDLAVATSFAGAVSIVFGDGLGGFNGATEIGTIGGPETLAIGDFNGDGRQDLVVVGSGASIRLGNCNVAPTPTPCPSCTPTPTPKAACETFSNSTPIILPFGSPSPYPSNINVSGIGGAITNVTVALNGLSHSSPDSIDILLVGPEGQYATILSDVGAHIAVSGVDLVLDDNAPNSLPDHSSLVSGVFRPTNFDQPACIFGGSVIDPFPSPAPYVSSTGSALSRFAGTNPNGIWSLYIVSYGGEGSLATGWSITISTDNCAGPTATPAPSPTPGATYFFVSAPDFISPSGSFQFTVTARDRFNNTATSYSGTIHFTTSEPCCLWSLPPDSGLTNGTGTFTVILSFSANANATGDRPLKIPWSSAITATDTIDPSITGTSNCINTVFPSPCPSCITPTPTPLPHTPTPTPVPPTPAPTPCGEIVRETFDEVIAPALPAGWVATNAVNPDGILWVTSATSPESAPNEIIINDPPTISDKRLDSPNIMINSPSAQVMFRHKYDLNPTQGPYFFDGAVLEVSSPNVSGGDFTDITDAAVGGSFVTGGYVGTISTSFQNPIGGRMAWSQRSDGYITTVANLGSNVNGQTIKLRFRMCSDSSVSLSGWRIDNVVVTGGSCSPTPTPTPVPPTPAPTPCNSVVVFQTDFETGLPPQFSGAGGLEAVQGYAGLGYVPNVFSGQFLRNATGGQSNGSIIVAGPSATPGPPSPTPTPTSPTRLTLTNLPPHHAITLRFLLAIIDSWDGTECAYGPDSFNVTVDGNVVFSQIFDNGDCGHQLYEPPPYVELARQLPLFGQNGVGFLDSAYDMGLEPSFVDIPHTSSTATIEWFASGPVWQSGNDESWAIENVEVSALTDGIECTPTPSPTPASVVRALNLSTRLDVGAGNDVGIGGFIITGTTSRQILLRGIGPSLASAGVQNSLSDPMLELHGPLGFTAVINNNWRDTQEMQISETGIAPTDDLESAILVTLDPGAYTVILKGNNDGTGVGLVEIYDLSPGNDSRLGNISTRGVVGTGSDIIIAGFILGGGSSDDVILVRGIGPSLIGSGVPNVLGNPMLELRDSNGAVVTANDDWQSGPPITLPPTDPLESAIETTLSPGTYTALLSGVNNGTGAGLVEVYDLGAPSP